MSAGGRLGLQVASCRLKVRRRWGGLEIGEVFGDALVDKMGRGEAGLEIGKLGGLLVDHRDVLGGEMNGGQSGVDGESTVSSLESMESLESRVSSLEWWISI